MTNAVSISFVFEICVRGKSEFVLGAYYDCLGLLLGAVEVRESEVEGK